MNLLQAWRPFAAFAAGLALTAAGGWAGTPPPSSSADEYRLFAPGAASDQRWAVSEAVDPDEARIGANDISRVRIAASSANVRVRIESAGAAGFVFGSQAVLAVQLYWFPAGEVEANYVQATIDSQRVNIIRLDLSYDPGCSGPAVSCADTVPHDDDSGPPAGTSRPEFQLP